MSVTNLDRVREARRLQIEEDEKRSAKFFRFKEGRNVIRVMPPWDGSEDFWKPIGQHFHIGPDGDQIVYCRQYTLGEKCFICEMVKKLYRGADEILKEKLKSLSSSQRYYVNIVDLNDIEKGVQIAELPKSMMGEVWSLMIDEEVGLGDITHPDKGFDLLIDRTGTGLTTKYTVRARRESTKIQKDWLTQVKDLDAFVKVESNDTLELIWSGEAKTSTAKVTEVKRGAVVEGDFRALPAPAPTPAPKDSSCFGSFNDSDNRCLECAEQDDCETEMLKRRREARRKSAEKASDKKSTRAPEPTTVSEDDLMAEMARAIEA